MVTRNFCTFYIVRHGQSMGNAQGVLQGHADYELSEKGKAEALQLAEELKNQKFDAAFASDLLRAHQTAQILAKEHQLVVATTELLREQTFGRYDGQPVQKFRTELKQLLKSYELLAARERFSKKLLHDIESEESMVGRFLTFLRETAVGFAGKKVLVVSHSGMMRKLLVHLGFASYEELGPDAIQNLGYFVLESDGVDFFVKDTKGIEKELSPNSHSQH